jgi:hypothetical protein
MSILDLREAFEQAYVRDAVGSPCDGDQAFKYSAKISRDASCRFITHLPLLPRQHVVGSGEQLSVEIVQYEPEYCTRIKYW